MKVQRRGKIAISLMMIENVRFGDEDLGKRESY